MAVKFQKQSELEGKLVINIVENDFKESYQQKLRDYAKKASIKGFRPGKVPASMVKNMMGEQLIVETISGLLSENLQKYIKEKPYQEA